MAHYKTMYDQSDLLFAFDLHGRDVTVTIERVYSGELVGEKGRKTRKPFLQFARTKKRLALNRTNGKTIAGMYGTDTDKWVGKSITLFPTTTKDASGETVECIRIKPTVPRGKATEIVTPEPPPAATGPASEPDPASAASGSDEWKREAERIEREEASRDA